VRGAQRARNATREPNEVATRCYRVYRQHSYGSRERDDEDREEREREIAKRLYGVRMREFLLGFGF